MTAPRVALVHDWLTGMRGGEKVLAAVAELLPRAPIYTLFHFPGSVVAELERHPIHTSFLQEAPGLRRFYRHYLPLFPAAIEDLDLSGYDVVVSTSHCVAKGVIPRPGAFHFCYCHTPMRYAWDQEQAYFPRRHGPVARLRGQVLSWLRTWDVASAGRVDRYVANSHFVADRIRRYYGREAEVLAPPVDTDFYSPGAGGADREYCLAVAALAPYKRVEVAIAACAQLGRELIVVGTGPEHERLERLAGPRARLLGGVSAERLRELYRGALCFVQPGIEDFGIAAAESLACGTPVVAFGRGGVCDIVEDGVHGVLYGPDDDPASMASAIDKCARIGFNKMKLRSRAELYSAPVFRQRLQDLLLSSRPDLEEAFA